MNRKLKKRDIDIVRNRVRQLIDDPDSEVSAALIAREVDYAASTISQWLGDTYRGKVDVLTRAVSLWLERWGRRAQSRSRKDYVETWAAETMVAFVRFCHRREQMGAIVAPSGSGKGMVISVLADELNGVIVVCNNTMTVKELLVEIGDRIGLTSRQMRTSAAGTVRHIVDKLRDKSATIFLDEAQQLHPKCAGVLRSIYDQTGVPIIMLGSAAIFDFINDRASGGGQLWRRCKKLNLISRAAREANPDDPGSVGRPLFSKEEIRRFIAMKQVRLVGGDDGVAFQMLVAMANMTEHGTLGLVNEVVETILDLYGDVEISEELIQQSLFMQIEDDAETILASIELETPDAAAVQVA